MEVLTTTRLAARLGLHRKKLVRLIEAGVLPEPERLGTFRLWAPSEVPAIRARLIEAGVLGPEGAATSRAS
jgi:predicted DNA-binding transcriptional regulator AlpA